MGTARPLKVATANGASGANVAAHSNLATGSEPEAGTAVGSEPAATDEEPSDGDVAAPEAANRSRAGGGVRTSNDASGRRETDPLAGAQLPFPPEHYVATIAELEVHEFPLPRARADGELVCPPGYVATRRRGARGAAGQTASHVRGHTIAACWP